MQAAPPVVCTLTVNLSDTRACLQGNQRLCGQLPTCLEQRVPSLNNTGLMNASSMAANPFGGSCSMDPPVCNLSDGCG